MILPPGQRNARHTGWIFLDVYADRAEVEARNDEKPPCAEAPGAVALNLCLCVRRQLPACIGICNARPAFRAVAVGVCRVRGIKSVQDAPRAACGGGRGAMLGGLTRHA